VTGKFKRFWNFIFPRESDGWLSLFRIGLGFQLALYCLSARPGWIEVFSNNRGMFSPRRVSEALIATESLLIPRVNWFLQLGSHLGISEVAMLWMIWSVLLLSAVLLVVGLFCRPAAVTAWLLHLACIKSSEVFAYGMDLFLNIGLFYLMLSPLPDSFALENRIWKPVAPDPRMVGFFRRVLQLHLSIIYFFSGLAKCLGSDWWNGMNIWAALTRPPFNILDPVFIARWRFVLPIAGIAVCLIEIGYPFFIWPRRTRSIWLACVVGMHLAVGLTMGMYLFALIMIILNLAAFAPDWIFRRNRSLRQPLPVTRAA
jgi:HTTM domain